MTRMITNDRIIEYATHFSYLENCIRYYKNYDIDIKLGKFQPILGTENRIFISKVVERQD